MLIDLEHSIKVDTTHSPTFLPTLLGEHSLSSLDSLNFHKTVGYSLGGSSRLKYAFEASAVILLLDALLF